MGWDWDGVGLWTFGLLGWLMLLIGLVMSLSHLTHLSSSIPPLPWNLLLIDHHRRRAGVQLCLCAACWLGLTLSCHVLAGLGWLQEARTPHHTPLSSLTPRFVFFTCAESAERLVYEHSRTDHGQKSTSKGPCCDSKRGSARGQNDGGMARRWRVPPPQKVPADSMVGAWWCGLGVRVCVRCGVRVSRRQNLRPACLDAINLQCHPWRESRPPRPTGDPSGSCGVGGSITSLCGVTGGRTAAAAAAAMLLPRCKGKPGKPG